MSCLLKAGFQSQSLHELVFFNKLYHTFSLSDRHHLAATFQVAALGGVEPASPPREDGGQAAPAASAAAAGSGAAAAGSSGGDADDKPADSGEDSFEDELEGLLAGSDDDADSKPAGKAKVGRRTTLMSTSLTTLWGLTLQWYSSDVNRPGRLSPWRRAPAALIRNAGRRRASTGANTWIQAGLAVHCKMLTEVAEALADVRVDAVQETVLSEYHRVDLLLSTVMTMCISGQDADQAGYRHITECGNRGGSLSCRRFQLGTGVLLCCRRARS